MLVNLSGKIENKYWLVQTKKQLFMLIIMCSKKVSNNFWGFILSLELQLIFFFICMNNTIHILTNDFYYIIDLPCWFNSSL